MTVRSIADYLGALPFFAGLDAASFQELAGCARNEHVRAGEFLFREGGTAEHFYVVLHGRIALEVFSPGTGSHVVDSAGDGEVLDWPWLIPPHRWLFDGRAVEPTSVVSLDSACLRRKCDADPRLGYEFVQGVAQVMSRRLQATRVRLLDLYGIPRPGADRSRDVGIEVVVLPVQEAE
jgi:CRP/FNR family transcriptional regulator, cyclic AMP receptor protein